MIDQSKIAERNAQAPKQTPEEARIIADAQKQSQEQMSRIGTGQGNKTVGQLVTEQRAGRNAKDSDFVQVNVPRPFKLTLDGPAREIIDFPRGVYPIPANLVGHWYVKAHGVEQYDGAGNIIAVQPSGPAMLSCAAIDADPGIDAAFATKLAESAALLQGLSVEQWNGLSDGDREALMTSVYRLAKDNAAANVERQKAEQDKAERAAKKSGDAA